MHGALTAANAEPRKLFAFIGRARIDFVVFAYHAATAAGTFLDRLFHSLGCGTGGPHVRKTFSVNALVSIVIACAVTGCVQVPKRDGIAAVDVNAVVKRIKCDLNRAVLDKAYTLFPEEKLPERRQPFLFLRSWAAKIRLTVAIDDSFQFNPGASYTQPLRTVNNAAQTFTIGAGGGLTTQAIRQEDIEFLMSFRDLDAEYNSGRLGSALYDFCRPDPGLLLESDLGLDRLIDAALRPVETGVLRPGNNFGPGAAPPPAIPKLDLPTIVAERRKVDPKAIPEDSIRTIAGQSEKMRQFSTQFIQKFNIPDLADKTTKELKEAPPSPKNENAERIKQILANSAEATSIETKTQAIINNVVKPRYSIAQGALDGSCHKPVAEAHFEAIAQSANVSTFVINIDKVAEFASDHATAAPPSKTDDERLKAAAAQSAADLQKLIDARDKVIVATNTMRDAMLTCLAETKKIQETKKREGPAVFDPVSTISETVNFYITLTGNVAPSWKLVRVTAPTSGNFLSGTRKDTNTLILSMGRPTPGTNGGPPTTPAIDQQILYSILGATVATRP